MVVARILSVAALLALAPLRGGGEEAAMSLSLSSSAFASNAAIPARYTCDGNETSPPLQWIGVPSEAKSLALIVDDPDAPDPAAPHTIWVHWVLYDLPPTASGLAEGVHTPQLPAGTREGVNDFGRTGYGGPCPPIGRHRYFFKLYALDSVLPDLQQPSKARLLAAMKGHVVAQAELVGTYQHGGH